MFKRRKGISNIKSIAAAAEVSVSTVSRVLNNRGYVKDSTRSRVQDTIERMNFRPNMIARSLRQRESRVVAVLQADNRTHFSANFADALEDRLFEHGIVTIIGNTGGNLDKLGNQIDMLLEMRVGAVVIRPSRGTQELSVFLRQLRRARVATVLVESYPLDPGYNNVCFDIVQGANLAMSHLLDAGHRNVGILVPSASWQKPGPHDLRLGEFKRLARNRDPQVQLHVVRRNSSDHVRFGQEETRNLLRRTPAIRAIIGATDLTSVGALRAARQLGRRVPDHLSIISCDDSYVSRSVQPTLTAIFRPIGSLGRAAADILYGAIKDPDFPPRTLTISNEIRVRDSST